MENKTNYVENPKTGRWIKVGGKLYNSLLAQKILNIESTGHQVLYEGDNAHEVKKGMGKAICDDKHSIKIVNGNKIIKEARKINRDEIYTLTAEKAIEVFKQNRHKFKDDMSPKEIAVILKNLIQQRMVFNVTEIKKNKKQNQYVLREMPDESSEEEVTDSESEEEDEEEDEDDDEECVPVREPKLNI